MPHKRPSCDNGVLGSGQVVSKKKKSVDSLFGEVLSDSGFILNFNNEPFTLETDQALFQRRLQKSLRAHPVHCYPASVKEFLRGLDTFVSDNAQLKWALLYTQTASGCSAASRAGHQDSLLRLLLNIDELQLPTITLLVERLLEVAYNVSSDDDLSLPRLILANLQRLDRLTEPAAVSDKMLELLLGAPPEVQKDIITFLPEVVDDATHPKVAEELCKLYYSSPELAVTILDALPSLSLSPEALLEVKHSVQKTVQAARPEHLPVVVKFLLEDAGRAEELIADLRRRLRLTPSAEPGRSQAGQHSSQAGQHSSQAGQHSSQAGHHSSQAGQHSASQAGQHSASHEMALLQNIKFAFQVEKRQHMSWLKALDGVAPPELHHPLDLLLLLQLHDTAPARQRLVEAVLKKKVRGRVFTREVLQQTFGSHAQTLKQFISTLRRLSAFLLRCTEPSLCSYGAEMYRLSFVWFSGYQQQEVVVGLLAHSADPPAVRQAALRLFQTLAEDNTDALARYAGFLKSWLDLLEQLTLPEARQLMEVLSTLAFRAPHEAATIGDELKLLIHKQLASSSNRYKRLGIISVLMAIKCRQNCGDSSATTAVSGDSQSSEIVLTTAGQRETVQLLQMAQTAVTAAPAARGLLLDELGSLVWRAGLDPKIESWICDQQMDEFQETFVVDLPEGEPQCDGLRVSLQYGLEEAAVGEIALNLAPMALHSADQLSTLCAHFRLLRMCVASLDGGTMEKLDALLGCPVILPADTEPETVSALPPAARAAVLTAHFHCVNFFRELLNAFSTQKDQEMKRRCVRRLRAVLQLEAQIRQLLPLVPGFVPPAAIFDADTPPVPPSAATKKPKPPPKRKGKSKLSARAAADTSANQTAISQLEAAGPAEERPEAADVSQDLAAYRLFFREMDMDVYKLLYRRLSLTDHTSEEFCLRPSELRLLLEDLALKLERRLAGGGGGGGGLAALHASSAAAAARGLGFSHLDLLPEASVARQAATLLKPLSVIADSIVTMFKSQIADNDGVLDGPGMFGEESARLSACLATVYRITATLLSWPGLSEADNQQLATEAVANLRLTDAGRSQLPASQQALHPAARAFALFEQHAASVPLMECAANLARTLAALAQLSGERRLQDSLADCAETLLKREWFAAGGARETGGALYGGRVAALLRLHLAPGSDRLLARLDTLAQTALTELLEATGREPASDTFPTLSKSTFGHYYRVMFAALVEAIRATVAAAGSDRSRLDRWASALTIFTQLVGCLRVFSSRSAVGVCLKHSRRLVDLFVRHAIPMLEQMLKHQRDDVLTILKNFQMSARYLHHVCNHSKNLKDASLMNHVPYLKKGLESFVFRVKAMLALNGCSDAFWMGNLKNRDLHGEEILSQQTDVGSGGEDDPDDAAESDVDLDAEEEHSSPDRPAAAAAVEDKQDSEISDAY